MGGRCTSGRGQEMERETEEEEERTGSTGLIHDIWMSNPPDAV